MKRRVGYLPDAVGFYGRLTGRENLRYTARLNGLEPSEEAERVASVLADVGLTDAADRPTDAYSRGMLQRLGIADALVKEPDVLILDEPTTSIDPTGVADLLDLVRRLVARARHRRAAVEPPPRPGEQLCDRVGIFSRGRLIAEGTVRELATRAGDPGLGLDEVYRRLARDGEGDRGRAA